MFDSKPSEKSDPDPDPKKIIPDLQHKTAGRQYV